MLVSSYRTKRIQLLLFLGGKCIKCGFDDLRALQIDHVNGGGCKEIRSINHKQLAKLVRADTTGKYQLLCANCNWIKRHETGESKNAKPTSEEQWKAEVTHVRQPKPKPFKFIPSLVKRKRNPETMLPLVLPSMLR